MNAIYSMIFWGNGLPRSVLKQKDQNVRIAPTKQIFHTFTDKNSQNQNFANSLTFSVSPKTFIKSNIFPEEISFNFANRKSLWKVPKKNTNLPPKGDISISSQG